MTVSVVMPARNEADRIRQSVCGGLRYADEVVVIDDGSDDETAAVAAAAGARVLRQAKKGYIAAVKRGFREASGDIIVTMDADGEHQPGDIPKLVAPIRAGKADLVLGRRPAVARPSERLLNRLTALRVRVSDSGTGFRALRRSLALRLVLRGCCICGISVLEPRSMGARVLEVPIELGSTLKRRRIAWFHAPQICYVLKWLCRKQRNPS